MKIIIGTRGSVLALWQANHIKNRLKNELKIDAELKVIKTTGDQILNKPLFLMGGKGLFTKELENALQNHQIHVAVHSLKDISVNFDENLKIAAICDREDFRDAFLSVKFRNVQDLPPHAKVGTTSLRRSMQLKIMRADLDVQTLRGNVQKRIERLENGDFDAIILANAAISRLQIPKNLFTFVFSVNEMLPAAGQGALGLQILKNSPISDEISQLNNKKAEILCGIERDFVRELGGGCQMPLGVLARENADVIEVSGILGGMKSGKKIHKILTHKKVNENLLDPEILALGTRLAQDFFMAGAREIMIENEDFMKNL